jgi:hypothetical protein
MNKTNRNNNIYSKTKLEILKKKFWIIYIKKSKKYNSNNIIS